MVQTPGEQLQNISKLQKCAACIILKTDYNTPSPEMFAELGWPTVPNRHNYNKAVLTYKALNNLTPEYISDLIKPLSETHTRNLRSVTDGSLKVPRSKTTLYDSSFSASAPKLWNALPGAIKTSTTLDSFKKAAKHHFM